MRTPTMDNPTIMLDGATMGIVDAFTWEAPTGTGDDMATSTRSNISGLAYLVSPEDGFASTYNATAINCIIGGNPNVPCNGGYITFQQRSQSKRHLIGRWVTSRVLNAATEVILTFPGTHSLNYQTVENDQPRTNTDPLTMYVFDEAGGAEVSHAVMLDQTVNRCRFEMMENGMTQVTCNGEIVIEGIQAEGGTFRIVNNTDKEYGDAMPMKARMGTETEGYTVEAQRYSASPSSTPPTIGLTVFGFVLSEFDVTSGMYDHLSPIRWHTGINPP